MTPYDPKTEVLLVAGNLIVLAVLAGLLIAGVVWLWKEHPVSLAIGGVVAIVYETQRILRK